MNLLARLATTSQFRSESSLSHLLYCHVEDVSSWRLPFLLLDGERFKRMLLDELFPRLAYMLEKYPCYGTSCCTVAFQISCGPHPEDQMNHEMVNFRHILGFKFK
jgi:hypothetical protein